MTSDNQEPTLFSPSDPSFSQTAGVGTLLRETRQKLGRELSVVAATLRIRQPFLEAIEDSRFRDLPGAAYAIGFVRGYAEYLGLDGHEIVRRFKQENGDLARGNHLVFPSAVSEGGIPTGALLGFAIVAAIAVYFGWHWYEAHEQAPTENVSGLPDRLTSLIREPVGNGTEIVAVNPSQSVHVSEPVSPTPPPPTQEAPPAMQAAVAPPAPPGSPPHEDFVPPSDEPPPASQNTAAEQSAGQSDQVAQPAPPPTRAAAKAAKEKAKATAAAATQAAETVASAAPDAATPPGEPPAQEGNATETSESLRAGGHGHVVLKAEDNCWIKILDANGKVVSSRLLKKGETFSAPSHAGLTMTVGNAGALKVLVNGKEIPSLGGVGMVRHDIPLDAHRLLGGDAGSEPSGDMPAPEPQQ